MQPEMHEKKPFLYASTNNDLTFMVKELNLTLFDELIFVIYTTNKPNPPLYEVTWMLKKDHKFLYLMMGHILEIMQALGITINSAFIIAFSNWIHEYLKP